MGEIITRCSALERGGSGAEGGWDVAKAAEESQRPLG